MIKVTNLSKEFYSGGTIVKAVDDISFQVATSSFVAIVGKSGSGKSTLLSLLGALEKPSQGSIEVEDQDITKLSDSKLVKYRRQKIGFVFQHYNLIPNLTAIENVMLPMEFAGFNSKTRQKRAKELLDEVGIFDALHNRLPLKLSGGEQQRVSIARALANKPKLILADEPTGNLDSNSSKNIIELLKDLARHEKTTIMVVTHDLGITRYTDKNFQLKDGKLTEHSGEMRKLNI